MPCTPPAAVLLALGPLLLSVIVLTVFPETAGVELATLNPEDAEVLGGNAVS